jgi:hypothetical protein
VNAEPRPLPSRYYLENFQRLCDTVSDQYGDLLGAVERDFLQRFENLDEEGRCLYVRLVSRRGPLFRRDKLSYPELEDLDAALAAAVDAGLLARQDAPEIAELAGLLRKDELVEIYGAELDAPLPARKAELVEALNGCLVEEAWQERWRAWCGDVNWLVEVRFGEVVALLKLLFFGNSWQDLTEFVLSDLGVASYHPYPLDREQRLFAGREEIDEYLELDGFKEAWKLAVEEGDTGTMLAVARLLDARSSGPVAAARRDRLRNRVARQLERENAVSEAEALYAGSGQHPARERRARLLVNRGDYEAALALCRDIQIAPWCEAEVDFAARQLPTIQKRLGQDHTPRRRDAFEEELLELPFSQPVEAAAAAHYGQEWATAHHVENMLFNGSFGLAFWEQIFAPVPGAFVNPFQAAPLDMYSREFHASRRDMIDRRLVELEQADLGGELLAAYDRHFGTANSWVAWRGLEREVLAAALDSIPRVHWLAIWRRLLFDPQANRAGCPDLVLLDPSRGYCLVEVKGPGDQLQLNQRRWLRFFQAEGIPARVAFVRWQDD